MENQLFKKIMGAWLGGELLEEKDISIFRNKREYELYSTCRAVQLCRLEIEEYQKLGSGYGAHLMYQRNILSELESKFEELLLR